MSRKADASTVEQAPVPDGLPISSELYREIEESIAKRESARIYQLSFWPDEKRAMPANFIACALFAAIQEQDACYCENLEIANANDLKIIFKGPRLTQVHADVWQGIMHLARQQSEGTKVRFRARQFLKLIGRQTGKKQRDDLTGWFSDLTATAVKIFDAKNKRHFWGSLLPDGAMQDEDDDAFYVVTINQSLAKLFCGSLGAVDWQVRRRLFKKPLALWWQFYSSNFTKPVAVAELHRLSGNGSPLKEFRRKLSIAMRAVEAAGGTPAYIDKATDSAVLLPPQRAGAKRPPDARKNANVTLVTSAAKEGFFKEHPGGDFERCLADWQHWLSKTGRTASFPDRAFLGFARKWGRPRKDARPS